MPKTFQNPESFKTSVEARIRQHAKDRGTTVNRERMLLIFDRFLARIERHFPDVATLKGGLALELRLSRARTTKDIDLRMMGSPDVLLPRLQEAGRLSLGDFLDFEVVDHPEHADMTGDGVRYDGFRFRVECQLAGVRYGEPFGLDIAFGDPILGEPEVIQAPDYLGFMGFAPPSIRVYPVETHIAEKLHAYTMPRERPNSRVKDLPDLGLLALTGPLEADRVRLALQQTFEFRDTHTVPQALPEPPRDWEQPYLRLARENQLKWQNLAQLTEAVRRFLDPILNGEAAGRWSPESWNWDDSRRE
jgi:hypothetical protein